MSANVAVRVAEGMTDDTWEAVVLEAYERHMRHLWEYARRLGLDFGQAEEAAQEAFARLLGLPRQRRPDSLEGWLFRTTRNVAMDQHRRLQRGTVRQVTTVSPSVADEAERAATWDAVDRLPTRQREAVYLRYRADLDYRTIASVLGISESGARANVFKAIEALRKARTDD